MNVDILLLLFGLPRSSDFLSQCWYCSMIFSCLTSSSECLTTISILFSKQIPYIVPHVNFFCNTAPTLMSDNSFFQLLCSNILAFNFYFPQPYFGSWASLFKIHEESDHDWVTVIPHSPLLVLHYSYHSSVVVMAGSHC